MDVLLGILLIVVAVVAFTTWVFMRVVGFIFRMLFGRSKASQLSSAAPAGVVNCHSARCRAMNPAFAQYCRQCGRPVADGHAGRVARMRYVA